MPSRSSPLFETILPNGEMLPVFQESPEVFDDIYGSIHRPVRLFVPLTRSALLLEALIHADGNRIREVVAVRQRKKHSDEPKLKQGDCVKVLLQDPLVELSEKELHEREDRLRVIEINPSHVGSVLHNKIFELNQLVEEYGNDTWEDMPRPGSIVAEVGATEFANLEPDSNVLLSVAIRTTAEPDLIGERIALDAFYNLRPRDRRGNRTWLGAQADRPEITK